MLGLHFAMIISQFYCQIYLPTSWDIIFLVAARTTTILHALIPNAVDGGGLVISGVLFAQPVEHQETKSRDHSKPIPNNKINDQRNKKG